MDRTSVDACNERAAARQKLVDAVVEAARAAVGVRADYIAKEGPIGIELCGAVRALDEFDRPKPRYRAADGTVVYDDLRGGVGVANCFYGAAAKRIADLLNEHGL